MSYLDITHGIFTNFVCSDYDQQTTSNETNLTDTFVDVEGQIEPPHVFVDLNCQIAPSQANAYEQQNLPIAFVDVECQRAPPQTSKYFQQTSTKVGDAVIDLEFQIAPPQGTDLFTNVECEIASSQMTDVFIDVESLVSDNEQNTNESFDLDWQSAAPMARNYEQQISSTETKATDAFIDVESQLAPPHPRVTDTFIDVECQISPPQVTGSLIDLIVFMDLIIQIFYNGISTGKFIVVIHEVNFKGIHNAGTTLIPILTCIVLLQKIGITIIKVDNF